MNNKFDVLLMFFFSQQMIIYWQLFVRGIYDALTTTIFKGFIALSHVFDLLNFFELYNV